MSKKDSATTYKMTTAFSGDYFQGVGRRKAAVARVRLYEKKDATEKDVIVNDRDFDVYFQTEQGRNTVLEPLKAAGMDSNFAMTVLVSGGGLSGQADAVKLGVARALTKYDADLRAALKAEGLLTRDARKVERKKPGLRKARRATQWRKR